MKQYLIYISIVLLAMLSACSTEDVDQEIAEGKMTTVTLAVSALSLGATSRATGTPEDPAYNVEKIHSWWVVFVDKNNTVRKIVSRSSELTSYVEEEQTKCDIPTGTYTLYSFANISQADLKTKTSLVFTEGSACPDVDSKTIALSNDWDKSTDIPMSGKQSVTVTGRANEVFSVEVVRMLAKLEFQYSNESSKDVTLNSLKITYNPSTTVPLIPNYTYLDSGWPLETPGAGVVSQSYTRTYTTTLTAYPGSGTAASSTDYFYMMESQANTNVSQRYLMTLTIERGGVLEPLMYALTKDMHSIYRNDHVIIPIIISDFTVDLDVNFYPPIGGYPAVITTNSKEEFYCQFATQGFFKISPSVINASNGHSVVYNDTSQDPYYTYTITGISNPDDIFSVTPAIEGGTGIIVGEMNTNEGTAYVDVEVTVHRSSSADQIYDRRVYIIRKNA